MPLSPHGVPTCPESNAADLPPAPDRSDPPVLVAPPPAPSEVRASDARLAPKTRRPDAGVTSPPAAASEEGPAHARVVRARGALRGTAVCGTAGAAAAGEVSRGARVVPCAGPCRLGAGAGDDVESPGRRPGLPNPRTRRGRRRASARRAAGVGRCRCREPREGRRRSRGRGRSPRGWRIRPRRGRRPGTLPRRRAGSRRIGRRCPSRPDRRSSACLRIDRHRGEIRARRRLRAGCPRRGRRPAGTRRSPHRTGSSSF